MTRTIVIKDDFSRYPGGRYRKHGPFSGEQFRDDCLAMPLRDGEEVEVVLDGAFGYPGSFLEEAFGGLVRVSGFSAAQLKKLLTITAKDPRYTVYRDLAYKYIKDAEAARRT